MEIIFHIGLIKTGTTFLQSQFFPLLKGVNYIGSNNNFFSRQWMVLPLDKILISNEGISGHPLKVKEIGYSYFDQFKNAVDNILSFSGKSRIVLGIREPASFLQSCYKQNLHEGGILEWKELSNLDDKDFLDQFKFSKFVKFLYEKFDSEDIFIYDQKDLLKNRAEVLEQLSEFITGKSQLEVVENVNMTRRSNPSVNFAYESYLLKLNRLNRWAIKKFKLGLTFKMFGKTLNQRVLIQYILPKIYNPKKKRSIECLKNYFASDWCETKALIRIKSASNNR